MLAVLVVAAAIVVLKMVVRLREVFSQRRLLLQLTQLHTAQQPSRDFLRVCLSPTVAEPVYPRLPPLPRLQASPPPPLPLLPSSPPPQLSSSIEETER